MKPAGWRGESYRHYLSSKGVRTGKTPSAYFMVRQVPRLSYPQIELRQVEKSFGKDAAAEARRLVKEEGFTAKEVVEHYSLPYLRKQRMGPFPPGREEIEGVPIEIHGTIGARRGAPQEVSAELAVEAVLRQEGRMEHRKLGAYLREQLEIAERRVQGIEYDLARSAGTAGISLPGNELMQRRLVAAREDVRRLEETRERVAAKASSGRYEEFVAPGRQMEIEDRIVRQPKREAAIADAIALPVQPVELSMATSWPRQDRAKQLRVSKFFMKKGAVQDGI